MFPARIVSRAVDNYGVRMQHTNKLLKPFFQNDNGQRSCEDCHQKKLLRIVKRYTYVIFIMEVQRCDSA